MTKSKVLKTSKPKLSMGYTELQICVKKISNYLDVHNSQFRKSNFILGKLYNFR